jgi:isoquinoline 1-oxidoreductase subunit alpha
MRLDINGQPCAIPPDWQDDTLLAVLREPLGLVGAKYGCGVGLCGACTVLVDGVATRSCILAARDAVGRSVQTIEGLAQAGKLHAVQAAWVEESVPQCGYCQAGQIMSTVALLRREPRPTDTQIDEALAGNLCRCGTQQRIRRAVKRAAGLST